MVGTPIFSSAEITSDATGRKLALTFDRNVSAGTGSATVGATRLFAMANGRTISTVGAPSISGAIATFDLREGKPVHQGETGVTVNIPSGLVVDADDASPVAASNDNAVTNNSPKVYSPQCRLISFPEQDETGTYTAEADAIGCYGVTHVVFTASDGVTTLTSPSIQERTVSSYDSWLCYRHDFDLSALNDGEITITATAHWITGGGTQQDSFTIWNNDGGTLPARTTYYAATTGNNTTGDGTLGNPFRDMGYCYNRARLNGDATCDVVALDDGSYDVRNGTGGNNYSPTRPVRFMRGGTSTAGTIDSDGILQGGVRLRPQDAQDLRPRILGAGMQANDVIIDLREPTNGDNVRQAYLNQYFDCFFTINSAVVVGTGLADFVPTILRGDVRFFGCTSMQIQRAFPHSRSMRNCTGQDFGSDFSTNASRYVVNCHAIRRGMGLRSLDVQYTNAGPATISRNASAQTITLNDPVNGSTVLSTSASGYSAAEAQAAINAVAGWSATNPNDNLPWTNEGLLDITATDATSVVGIWVRSGDHSDLLQWFNDDFSNVLVNGVRTTVLNPAEFPGLDPTDQVVWLDHASVTHDGLAIANVSDGQMMFGATRSGIQSTLKDVMFIFCSTPWTNINFINGSGPSGNVFFIPDNVYTGASVWRSQATENFSAGGNPVDIDEVYLGDTHWNNTSPTISSGDFLGTLTTGTVEDEFSDEGFGTPNLTPINNIVARTSNVLGFPDTFGRPRNDNSALGAQRAADETGSGGGTPMTTITDNFTRTTHGPIDGTTFSESPGFTWNNTGNPFNTHAPGLARIDLDFNRGGDIFCEQSVASDVTVTVNLNPWQQRRSFPTVIARAQDGVDGGDTYYNCRVLFISTGDQYVLLLRKRVAGVTTVLDTLSVADNQTEYENLIQNNSSVLSITVDGTSISGSWEIAGNTFNVSATDSDITAGDFVGASLFKQSSSDIELTSFNAQFGSPAGNVDLDAVSGSYQYTGQVATVATSPPIPGSGLNALGDSVVSQGFISAVNAGSIGLAAGMVRQGAELFSEVANFSVGGSASAGLAAQATSAIAGDFDVSMIHTGSNDAVLNTDRTTYITNLRNACTSLRNAGHVVILCVPIQRDDAPWTPTMQTRLEEYWEDILAEPLGTSWDYLVRTDQVPEWSSDGVTVNADMKVGPASESGVHPPAEGSYFITNKIIDTITQSVNPAPSYTDLVVGNLTGTSGLTNGNFSGDLANSFQAIGTSLGPISAVLSKPTDSEQAITFSGTAATDNVAVMYVATFTPISAGTKIRGRFRFKADASIAGVASFSPGVWTDGGEIRTLGNSVITNTEPNGNLWPNLGSDTDDGFITMYTPQYTVADGGENLSFYMEMYFQNSTATGGTVTFVNPDIIEDVSDAGDVSLEAVAGEYQYVGQTPTLSITGDVNLTAQSGEYTYVGQTAILNITGVVEPVPLRRLSVTGTFAADGTSLDTLTNSATVFITGSFVGTINVQARTEAGDWVNTYQFTGVGSEAISFARERPVRLNATVTSGEVEYSIENAVEFLDER